MSDCIDKMSNVIFFMAKSILNYKFIQKGDEVK